MAYLMVDRGRVLTTNGIVIEGVKSINLTRDPVSRYIELEVRAVTSDMELVKASKTPDNILSQLDKLATDKARKEFEVEVEEVLIMEFHELRMLYGPEPSELVSKIIDIALETTRHRLYQKRDELKKLNVDICTQGIKPDYYASEGLLNSMQDYLSETFRSNPLTIP
ncbi:MAG: hypothetical protein M0Q12_06080, partial [Synergistaceae bacterium]|nr:hypothetical protein [Synergistaceae bacterium]